MIVLDTMVTVVDCERFLQDYYALESVGDRKDFVRVEGADTRDKRGVVVSTSSTTLARCECINVRRSDPANVCSTLVYICVVN